MPSLWEHVWTCVGHVRARVSRVTPWGRGKGRLKGPGKKTGGRQGLERSSGELPEPHSPLVLPER